MSLRFFGLPAFRQAIDRCLDLALYAQSQIEAHPQLELMSPASLGIVTFRRHPVGEDDEGVLERINADIADQIENGRGAFRLDRPYPRPLRTADMRAQPFDARKQHVDRAIELAGACEVDLGGTGRRARAASAIPT